MIIVPFANNRVNRFSRIFTGGSGTNVHLDELLLPYRPSGKIVTVSEYATSIIPVQTHGHQGDRSLATRLGVIWK